jgi:HlyD family secretion protein|tara:strand:+ start:32298 stop:33569 length:1272 start_codon:yes stop_codon:yes gene_type:complete
MIRDTSAQDEIIEPTRSKRKWWIAGTVIGLMTLSSVFVYPSYQRWASAEQSISKERLRLSTVDRGTLVRDVSAQGKVVASIKPTLFSPATGVVTLMVEAGDSVSKGQLIAEIESPEIKNLLDQEISALQSAETEFNRKKIQANKTELQNQQTIDLADVALVAARRELRRAEAAHSKEAISEFDYDKANDDVSTAELKFKHSTQDAKLQTESLQFELQTSELQIERQRLKVKELTRQVSELSITSPVTGIVGNLAVDNKDAVAKNMPLVTVVDLSAFEIELQVPDNFSSGLEIGLDAEISHSGILYPGRLVSISPEVINSQITTKVRFTGETPPNLKQNQRVSARILLESRANVLMVKRGPFLESGGGRFAYLVEDDLARKQSIRIGVTSVANVEILSGLEEDQVIIISNTREFEDSDVVYLTD